jgi:hypothetical protein
MTRAPGRLIEAVAVTASMFDVTAPANGVAGAIFPRGLLNPFAEVD